MGSHLRLRRRKQDCNCGNSDEIDHKGKTRNTGHHWFAGYGYHRSFLSNLAIQVNVPSQRRQPPITLQQDAFDELNKWKAYEAAKKQKQNEKAARPGCN